MKDTTQQGTVQRCDHKHLESCRNQAQDVSTMQTTPQKLPRYGSDVHLAELFGVSRATIWRWAASGILPQPIKLSPGCTRWRLDQIKQLGEAA